MTSNTYDLYSLDEKTLGELTVWLDCLKQIHGEEAIVRTNIVAYRDGEVEATVEIKKNRRGYD